MELFCDFDNSSDYCCNVKSAAITQPLTEIKSVNGDHHSNKTKEDVKFLKFEKTVVNFFPRGINLIFPNLNKLVIFNCGLKKISRQDLIGFEKLEHLSLSKNKLTALPNDLFVDMTNLKWIDFNLNKIEFMTSKLLEPIMKNLIRADFMHNTKISSTFNPGAEKSEISIANLMQVIDAQCFKPNDSESCEINFMSEEEKRKLLTTQQTKLIEGASNLWLSRKFSDFLIVAKGSIEFPVHKNILAAQSKGFAEMFEKNPNQTRIKIDIMSAEAVGEFLCFLYTGKLSHGTTYVMEIYDLANRLNVPEIKEVTGKVILRRLNDSNAYETLVFGHYLKSTKIQQAAFEKIKEMFPDKNLPDNLIDDLEGVKELIEAMKKIDAVLKKV